MNSEFEYPCGNDMRSNPYALLGIRNCENSQRIIKKSGRALRAAVHPDKNPGNQYAQQSFIIAQSATDILTNPTLKRHCDNRFMASSRCFEKTRSYGPEAKLLEKFYKRQKELERTKLHEALTASVLGMMDIPRRSYKTISKYVKQAYKSQTWRVRKAYRDFKRWPYGGRAKKPSRYSRNSKNSPSPTGPSRTSDAVRPQDDESPAGPQPSSHITEHEPARTFTVTETQTVTKTETETETITAFGLNFAEHRHNVKQFVRDIDSARLAIGVAAVVCAAGCTWYIQSRRRRRARAVVPEVVGSESDGESDGDDNGGSDYGDDDRKGDGSVEAGPQNEESAVVSSQPRAEDHEHDVEDQDDQAAPDDTESDALGSTDGLEAGSQREQIEGSNQMDLDEDHTDEKQMTGHELTERRQRKDSESRDAGTHVDDTVNEHVPQNKILPEEIKEAAPVVMETEQAEEKTPEPKKRKRTKTPRTEPARHSRRLAGESPERFRA